MWKINQFYKKNDVAKWTLGNEQSFKKHLEHHKFYPKGGWFKKQLFNFIIWVLGKLKLETDIVSSDDIVLINKSYRLDQTTLEKLISRQEVDLNWIWEEKPRYLIIGQDTFYELFDERATSFQRTQVELPIKREVQYNDEMVEMYGGVMPHDTETMFWGFNVLVVPWIEGCFLLPNI